MNWDDMRILLALVRSGSLTRASLVLGIDQSTVGRRLSTLEAALGTTLFLRSKSGLIPTEIGEKLVADALEMERRAERIAEIAAAPADDPAGELRIQGDAWVLERLTDRFLPDLLLAYPRMSVRLASGPAMPASWTAATLSLRFEDPPQMGEFAIRLVDVAFAVYAPRDRDATTLGWVAMRDDSAARRGPARAVERLRAEGETVPVLADDPVLLRGAIRAGMGKGLLPVCMADEDPGLRRIGDAATTLARPLHLHAHPDTVQTRRVQTGIRQLRERAAALFGSSVPETPPRPVARVRRRPTPA